MIVLIPRYTDTNNARQGVILRRPASCRCGGPTTWEHRRETRRRQEGSDLWSRHHGSRPGAGVRDRGIRRDHVLPQGRDPREGRVGAPRPTWPPSSRTGCSKRARCRACWRGSRPPSRSKKRPRTPTSSSRASPRRSTPRRRSTTSSTRFCPERTDHHQQHLLPQHLRHHAGPASAPDRHRALVRAAADRAPGRSGEGSRDQPGRPSTSWWSCSRRSTGCPPCSRSSCPASASTASCASSGARSSSCSTTAT